LKFRSLRIRLLLTFILVVTVAIGTVAYFASRSTTNEFRRSVEVILDYPNIDVDSKINAINKYLQQHGGERDFWEGMQILLERMGRSSQARFVLADLAGKVTTDSTGMLLGGQLNTELSKPFAVFLMEGKPILAYVVPLEETSIDAIEDNFSRSVSRSLWLAIGAAGAVALLLTLFLSQSILGPIGALTSAARQMEKGDLSQRVEVRTADELGELASAFNAMTDGLKRLEQLRRNMVTDVAHELRTPLSNVRGYLEAIKDGMIAPTSEVVESLHEEAMLLSRLVDDLQELALAEAGQLKLVRQELQLSEVVEKVVHLVHTKAAEKDLALQVHLPGDLPPVYADAERLGQIMRNLLNNAITNTAAGGEIWIAAKAMEAQVEVSVRDTGKGIAAEHLPYVFERFYRADKSRTRLTGGAGLGLAIVRQLVESHGGEVKITSQVGAGTMVTFTIPKNNSGNHHAIVSVDPSISKSLSST
jgi:signal transduction histidine kinase